MTGHAVTAAIGDPARSRRTYTVTARITVHADLADPFARVAVFRALVDQLTAAPLDLDTPFGAASARVGLVTAVSGPPAAKSKRCVRRPHPRPYKARTVGCRRSTVYDGGRSCRSPIPCRRPPVTHDHVGVMLDALLSAEVPGGYASVRRDRYDVVLDHTFRDVTISPVGVDVATFTFGIPGVYAHICVDSGGDTYTVGVFATDVAYNVQSAGHVVAFTTALDAVACAVGEVRRHLFRQERGW